MHGQLFPCMGNQVCLRSVVKNAIGSKVFHDLSKIWIQNVLEAPGSLVL
jgi:hypothetical protein